ncbi:MAG TPA: hypothetical protein DDX84_12050 [Nitrospiraceae bacterium]|nr:hypothetical protein [Nitrospiraceae bacterium]
MKDRRQKTEDRRQIVGYIIGLMIILFLINGEVIAAGKSIKDKGTLTSVESNGTVIIDEKGYKIDSSARIIDKKGKRVAIYNLSLPANVFFEYEYRKNGFVIKVIEEFPEILPK